MDDKSSKSRLERARIPIQGYIQPNQGNAPFPIFSITRNENPRQGDAKTQQQAANHRILSESGEDQGYPAIRLPVSESSDQAIVKFSKRITA